jgi:hypothetical protein
MTTQNEIQQEALAAMNEEYEPALSGFDDAELQEEIEDDKATTFVLVSSQAREAAEEAIAKKTIDAYKR